jgi:hypothetical protein
VKPEITLPICCVGAVLLLGTPTDAWAYVDPGTGSYLFQLTFAGLLAAAYTIRRYWQVLTTAFRARLGRDRVGAPDGE